MHIQVQEGWCLRTYAVAFFAAASAFFLNASSDCFWGTKMISRFSSLKELPFGKPRLRASASSLTSSSFYGPVQSQTNSPHACPSRQTYHHEGLLDAEYRITLQKLIAFRIPRCSQLPESRRLDHHVQMVRTHVVPPGSSQKLSDRTLIR